MILQFLNIVGGLILSSSFFAEKFPMLEIDVFLHKNKKYTSTFGFVVLVFGVLGVVERLGFFHLGLPLGSSFPQALPAIAAGILLSASRLEKYGFFDVTIKTLSPYRTLIGFIGIASGLGSLLFGCIMPIGCTPFF